MKLKFICIFAVSINKVFITAIFKKMLSSNDLQALPLNCKQSIVPVCSDPKLIFNRQCIPYLLSGARYFLGDYKERVFCGGEFVFNHRVLPNILSHRDFVTEENFDKYYLYTFDGEVLHIFQYVPCGHCQACQHSKKFSFAQMCIFETLSHSFCPIFGTLTYDNAHLPLKRQYNSNFLTDYFRENPDSALTLDHLVDLYNNYPDSDFPAGAFDNVPTLCSRDVQLFLKRFRQNLKRKFGGKYDFPLRYAICGEYGRKSGRPHYHFIFWNLHAHNYEEYNEICDLIESSWQNGFVQTRVVDVRKNDKCFEYTAKYVAKSGESKSMRMSSKRNGGIGKAFLLEHFADFLSKGLHNSPFYYYNQFTASIGEVVFVNRVNNIVAPSFARLLPVHVRDAFKESNYFIPNNELANLAKDFIYIPERSMFDVSRMRYSSFDECFYHISKFFYPLGCFTPEDIRFKIEELHSLSVRNQAFLLTRFSKSRNATRSQLLYKYKCMENRSNSLLNQYAEIYG